MGKSWRWKVVGVLGLLAIKGWPGDKFLSFALFIFYVMDDSHSRILISHVSLLVFLNVRFSFLTVSSLKHLSVNHFEGGKLNYKWPKTSEWDRAQTPCGDVNVPCQWDWELYVTASSKGASLYIGVNSCKRSRMWSHVSRESPGLGKQVSVRTGHHGMCVGILESEKLPESRVILTIICEKRKCRYIPIATSHPCILSFIHLCTSSMNSST